MRIKILIVLLLCPMAFVNGQTVESQLKDATSQTPIRYANIGIAGKNMGTVSDSLGNFRLSLAKASDMDTLRISMIGYKSKNYKIGVLNSADFPKLIFLNEKIVQLQEVVVRKAKPFQIGLQQKYGYPIPLYKGAQSKVAFPQKSYRHEIGTRFSNSNTMSLDSIRINFAECNVEHLTLRLNVYAVKPNGTILNVLRQPIYISLTKAEALNSPVVSVVDQQLEMAADFLVTLENYRQLKERTSYLFANFKRRARAYPTYYRNSSQSDWVVLKSKKAKPIAISIVAFGH